MVTNAVQLNAMNMAGETPAPRGLPPSERDLEVYEVVVVEGASTRAAAKMFGVSQTRIVQICERVAEWIGSEVPPTQKLTSRQRLCVAANLAERRLDHLYSQAMEAWRGSKGPQTIMRTGGSGAESTSTRQSFGDGKYLIWAMRIAERGVRLGAVVEKAVAGTGDQESGVGNRKSEVGSQCIAATIGRDEGPQPDSIASPANPPVRDCSQPAEVVVQVTGEASGAVVTTHLPNTLSDENRQRRKVFFGGPDGVVEDCSGTGNGSKPVAANRRSGGR